MATRTGSRSSIFGKQKSSKQFTDLIRVVLETSFKEIDVNNDGTLDASELKAVGFSLEMMNRLDTNQDGKLQHDEFVEEMYQIVTRKSDEAGANALMSESIQLVVRVLKARHAKDAQALGDRTAELAALAEKGADLSRENAVLLEKLEKARTSAEKASLAVLELEAERVAATRTIATLEEAAKTPTPVVSPEPVERKQPVKEQKQPVKGFVRSLFLLAFGAGAALVAAQQSPMFGELCPPCIVPNMTTFCPAPPVQQLRITAPNAPPGPLFFL